MRRGRPSGRSGIVTLLTDFGLDDAYVGTVKGVILGINPAARLVDLTHAVLPQDVRTGAELLAAAWRVFPRGTVHLAVVDPGVGTARRPIAVSAGGHCFVGPDNGLLGFCFEIPGARGVVLQNPRYRRAPVSRTFHARDVFAPAAAHCSRGVPLRALGPPLADPVRLPSRGPRVRRGRVTGEVIWVDRFGNLLTNVRAEDVAGDPAAWSLRIGRARIPALVGTYGDCPAGRLGALLDSSGRIEIFVREGSAARRLGAGPGTPVSLGSRSPTTSRRRSRTSRTSSSRRTPRRSASSPPSTRSPSSRPRPPSSGTRTGSRSRTSPRLSG
jgi:S-adenosylmethionine hydrolase